MVRWLILGLVATTPAAWAQQAPEVRQTQTIDGLYQAARCIVQHDRNVATQLVETLPLSGNLDVQAASRLIAPTNCLDRPLPSNASIVMRGAIVQALFDADFPEYGAAPQDRARLVNLNLPVGAVGGAEPASEPDGDRIIYRWADCVVRNDTRNTERLLRTPPDSRREQQVLSAMAPYMNACGRDVALSIPALNWRSLFAQSAYNGFYRYWRGELAAAGEGTGFDNRVRCRTYAAENSRVRTERICMTERDWRSAAVSVRQELDGWMQRTYSAVAGGPGS